MTITIFSCDGAKIPREWRGRGPIARDLRTHGSQPNVNFHIEDLEHAFLGRLDGTTYDLVRIASYVHAADQSVRRGGRSDWRLEAWTRELRLAIPVNDPDLWNEPKVKLSIEGCVGFLTGDDWRFSFVPTDHDDERQLVLPEGVDQALINDFSVIPFSGGIDSLAVAVEELSQNRKPLLVSHRSAGMIEGNRRELAAALKARFGNGSFSRLDAAIHRVGNEAPERTRRSRTFLYGCLAVAAAERRGGSTVLLSDNGVVSLNLPINRQLIGSRASRATHPRFIRLFNELLAKVLDEAPLVRNPLWDATRVEVVKRIEADGQLDLIGLTISCANVQRRERSRPHCGYCSQCIDRRFATDAANAGEHDPAERYGLDVFRDALPEGDARTTAISYVRWARHIERLTDDQILVEYPELLDAPNPGRAAAELEAYVDLIRRHSKSVLTVLGRRLAASATSLARGELPSGSLLVMTASESDTGPPTEFSHSESYQSVQWRGETFTSTPAQATVIGNLHKAHEQGIQWVATRDALNGADTASIRMSDVFKHSPAWKRLVIAGRPGQYRLDLSPEQ